MTYYYKTKVGICCSYEKRELYFSNNSDLLDHFQAMFNCTANEIEFHPRYKTWFKKLNGSIDANFCANHNSGLIDETEVGFHELDSTYGYSY